MKVTDKTPKNSNICIDGQYCKTDQRRKPHPFVKYRDFTLVGWKIKTNKNNTVQKRHCNHPNSNIAK